MSYNCTEPLSLPLQKKLNAPPILSSWQPKADGWLSAWQTPSKIYSGLWRGWLNFVSSWAKAWESKTQQYWAHNTKAHRGLISQNRIIKLAVWIHRVQGSTALLLRSVVMFCFFFWRVGGWFDFVKVIWLSCFLRKGQWHNVLQS